MNDWHDDEWLPPYAVPDSPTGRDGLHVGDRVVLVSHSGNEWPAEVVGFNSLPHDIVIRWTGLRPLSALSDDVATICRTHLREVRHA